MWAEFCDDRVFLSVRMHVWGTTCPNFNKFSVHVAIDCCSVLLWQSCNMLHNSGCVDDVMFSNNGPYGGVTLPQQPRRTVVYVLTPLLRGISCVCPSRRRAPRLDESSFKGFRRRSMQCTIALLKWVSSRKSFRWQGVLYVVTYIKYGTSLSAALMILQFWGTCAVWAGAHLEKWAPNFIKF